jgi:hypothetical protein
MTYTTHRYLHKYSVEELRSRATERDLAAIESFERCDTDGYLSQWGSNVMSRVYTHAATLAENGWKDEFVRLADLEGNLVNAKLIDGQYGTCWAMTDTQGQFTGQFISAFPKRESTMAKKGYREVYVMAPATVANNGTGQVFSVEVA